MTSITSSLSSVVAAAATVVPSSALASSSAQQAQPSAFSLALQSASPTAAPVEQGVAQAAERYLLPAGQAPDRESMPNIAQFMQATGASFEDSSSVLYGVIGSNADLRDWKAIMQSPDPLQAARQAVGAMYNSTLDYVVEPTLVRAPDGVVAHSGNVAWTQSEQGSNLFLVDGRGQALRQLPPNEKDALQTMQDFGFALKDLADLADKLDALGVKHLGVPSAGGVGALDLRGMAQRSASAAVDAPGTAGAVDDAQHRQVAATDGAEVADISAANAANIATAASSGAALQVALQLAQAWGRYEASQSALDPLQK